MDGTVADACRREMVALIAAHAMLVGQVTGRPRLDPRVMTAMERVPRHAFVPAAMQEYAYVDSPLPIGHDKTISQPFIVALMSDLLEVQPGDRVFEVGTGLGYQAAVLAELGAEVFSMEIIGELAEGARERLTGPRYAAVTSALGDGSRGWRDQAPFQRIILTAAPELVPSTLLDQLQPGGRMVLPIGAGDAQVLVAIDKEPGGRVTTREILPVRFSPMILAH